MMGKITKEFNIWKYCLFPQGTATASVEYYEQNATYSKNINLWAKPSPIKAFTQ